MQNTNNEVQPETTPEAEPSGLSKKFGDIGALLAQDVAVVNGSPVDIDPTAEPVDPVSMTDLRPDPASTEARVALERQAAQAVLDAANQATLAAIANGEATDIVPHLKDNPALLDWMRTEANRLIASNAQRAGGAVLSFEVRPVVPERAHIVTERSHLTTRRPMATGPRHAAGERRSFFEERNIYTSGKRYRPAHLAQ